MKRTERLNLGTIYRLHYSPPTSTADNNFAAYNGWQRNAYSGTGATNDSLGFKQIPTTGSI